MIMLKVFDPTGAFDDFISVVNTTSDPSNELDTKTKRLFK